MKVCPFEAITILKLSEELKEEKIHQYGVNTFRLYRLPTPRKGQVVGLVGRNGTGKSTALQILSGQLVPNLGDYEHPATWSLILDYLSGKELKEHFEKVESGEVRISLKPQAVYRLPEVWKKDVSSLLSKMDETGEMESVVETLGLGEALGKNVGELSGGELQRVAVAVASLKDADMYLFDEPSSYNDVYQRLAVSKLVRSIAEKGKYVLLVEHDITFLDYASDYVQIVYGEPGVYGIVSSLYPSRSGINALLDGFLPNENTRFRDKSVTFDVTTSVETQQSEEVIARYGALRKAFPGFELEVERGRDDRRDHLRGDRGERAREDDLPAHARGGGEARLRGGERGRQDRAEAAVPEGRLPGDGPRLHRREGGEGVRRRQPPGLPRGAAEDREALPEERLRPERRGAPEARDSLHLRRAGGPLRARRALGFRRRRGQVRDRQGDGKAGEGEGEERADNRPRHPAARPHLGQDARLHRGARAQGGGDLARSGRRRG